MRSMSECRVRFGHCVRSFLSSAMYKSVLTKRIAISGSVFRALIHFCRVSTNTVDMSRLPSWVHWYRCCNVSGVTPQHGQMVVVACLCYCMIFMVDMVILMHFLMKCDMWDLIVSGARLNGVRSISFQSDMWVRFWLSHFWIIGCLEIPYAIDWAMLKWIGDPCIEVLGIPFI